MNWLISGGARHWPRSVPDVCFSWRSPVDSNGQWPYTGGLACGRGAVGPIVFGHLGKGVAAFWLCLHLGKGCRAVVWRGGRLAWWPVSVVAGWRGGVRRWAVASPSGFRVVFLGDFFDRSCRNRVLEAVLCSWRSCAPFSWLSLVRGCLVGQRSVVVCSRLAVGVGFEAVGAAGWFAGAWAECGLPRGISLVFWEKQK